MGLDCTLPCRRVRLLAKKMILMPAETVIWLAV